MQPTDLRSHNLAEVLSTIARATVPPSRAELAQQTGLTKPTVSKLVEALLEADIISEGDSQRRRSSGRPTIPLTLSSEAIVGIGITISADQVAVLSRDLAGNDLYENRIYNTHLADPHNAARIAGELIAEAVLTLHRPERISGITVSIPGRMSEDRLSVVSSPGLGWKNVPFAQILRNNLHEEPRITSSLPQPLLGNDARLVARSEMMTRPNESFLLVHGETGIGGTVVLNGEILHGAHGWAGEIGHTVIDPQGPRCHCGNNGCLESFASAWALRERAHLSDDVHLDDLANHVPSAILQEAGYAVGLAIANSLGVLDLPTVVMAGYFGTHIDVMTPQIRAALNDHLLDASSRTITLARAHVDDSPALLGATQYALLPVLQDPVWFMERIEK